MTNSSWPIQREDTSLATSVTDFVMSRFTVTPPAEAYELLEHRGSDFRCGPLGGRALADTLDGCVREAGKNGGEILANGNL